MTKTKTVLPTTAPANSTIRTFKHRLGFIVASNIGRHHLIEFFGLDKKPRGKEKITFNKVL